MAVSISSAHSGTVYALDLVFIVRLVAYNE